MGETKFLSPLSSWDIYSVYFAGLLQKARIELDLEQLTMVLNGNLERSVVAHITEEDYDALIVTDVGQKIAWVSRGFTEMTGYSKSFSIGKYPNFLQGVNTSDDTKRALRKQLKEQVFSSKSIINYRKNGEEYHCQIKILPLFDKENKLSHYLAIERELQAA